MPTSIMRMTRKESLAEMIFLLATLRLWQHLTTSRDETRSHLMLFLSLVGGFGWKFEGRLKLMDRKSGNGESG